MRLDPHHIHIWSIDLSITPVQENILLTYLTPDEKERVHRIRLSPHKQRSIAARAYLRRILGVYLEEAPTNIALAYNDHGKPSLVSTPSLQFNLTHSDSIGLVAITRDHPIGVDIEKIQETYNPEVANRYFSALENANLKKLPTNAQTTAFYRIWSRKEALVKAIGSGLTLPLHSFSVAVSDCNEVITLQNQDWSLFPLTIHTDYCSAVATAQTINTISHWRLTEDGYTMSK